MGHSSLQYHSEHLQNNCFAHIMSSPRYPKANGEAEHAVQRVKCLWKNDTDQTRALVAYRATPLEHGYSPAQLLIGRNLCKLLPQSSRQLTPKWPDLEAFHRKDQKEMKILKSCLIELPLTSLCHLERRQGDNALQ